MAGRLELSLTESYAKHKRNLLIICSIIITIAFAEPAQVKIPGLGTDLNLSAPISYFLLGVALLYLFASYYIEMLATRARNSEAIINADGSNVDEKLHNQFRRLKTEFDAGIYQFGQLKNDIANSSTIFNSNGAEVLRANLRQQDISNDSIKPSLSSILHQFKLLLDVIERVDEKAEYINDQLSKLETDCASLDGKFNRLSDRISKSQRGAFWLLDRFVPSLFAATSLLICVDGAFHQSKVTSSLLQLLSTPPVAIVSKPVTNAPTVRVPSEDPH